MEIDGDTLFRRFKIVQDRVDAELLNHPRFIEQFKYVCGQVGANLQDVRDYDIEVSNDGKTIIVIAEGKYKVSNTQTFQAGEISLNNGTLIVTRSSGDLREATNDDIKKYQQPRYVNPKAILSTYYENRIYDENGIQLSYGKYTDKVELYTTLKEWEPHIRKLTLSTENYAPIFDGSSYPSATYSFDASIENYYRNKGNLGVVFGKEIEGITKNEKINKFENSSFEAFQLGLESPENLRIIPVSFATWSSDERKFILTDKYNEYPNCTYGEALIKIKENFDRIVERKITSYNQELYQAMLDASKRSRNK